MGEGWVRGDDDISKFETLSSPTSKQTSHSSPSSFTKTAGMVERRRRGEVLEGNAMVINTTCSE
jgi:hypothetical protein